MNARGTKIMITPREILEMLQKQPKKEILTLGKTVQSIPIKALAQFMPSHPKGTINAFFEYVYNPNKSLFQSMNISPSPSYPKTYPDKWENGTIGLWLPIGSISVTPMTEGKKVVISQPTGISPQGLSFNSAIFTVKDRENTFTINAGNWDHVYKKLDDFSAVDKTTWKGRVKSTKKIHFIRKRFDPSTRQTFLTADIGMMYYFADHLVQNGFDIHIDDQRKKIQNNIIEIEGKIDPETGEPFTFYDYQRKAIEWALKRKNGILRLATGAGKTEIAIGLIGKLGEDALFIVPRKTLAIQTRDRFIQRGFKNVGILYGEEKEMSNTRGELDVNVCVINTVQDLLGVTKPRKTKNLEIIRKREEQKKVFFDFMKEVNVIVFDEAHHIKAETYAGVARANPASFRYGLSATPFADTALETAQVREKLGDILYDLPASKLIEYTDGRQFLSQPIIKFIANIISDNLIPLFNKLYAEAVARAEARAEAKGYKLTRPPNRYPSFIEAFIILNEARNQLIVDICHEGYKRAMPTLVIVERIDHGVRLKMMLDELKIPCEMVASSADEGEEEEEGDNEAERVHIMKSKEERDQTFKDVASKKISVMIGTSGLVGEGLDIKALMLCIIAQGGKSFIRTYQRIGRAMRLHPAETTLFRQTHSLIVDFCDGMTFNKLDFTENVISERPTPGFIPMKYLGEHFYRRKNLYESESHFVTMWAKNLKDIFKVKTLDGQIIDPWKV